MLEKVRVFLLLFVFGGAFSSAFSESITIIHSNDTHGRFVPYSRTDKGQDRLVGGMEAVSHYLKLIRETDKNVLVVDKGDIMTGTFATAIDYKGVIGGVMIEFLNRLGYDIWNYGNHEFDKGQENALGLAGLAEFPTIMANVVFSEDKSLFSEHPFHILDVNGLKVGIIAVMEENFLVEVHHEKVRGLGVLPIISTLESYVTNLDSRSDLIIVVVHSNFNDGLKVADQVPGIDVVLVASEEGRFEKVGDVLVQSTIGHQQTLGYLKLDVEDDRVIDYQQKLIWLWADVELNPDPQIRSLIEELEASIGEECKKVIGQSKSELKKLDYPSETRNAGNTLGNWITDVMRWKTDAQIALHNSGAIRASLAAGDICVKDIFEVSPFNNTLVLFEITAEELKQILEMDVERVRDRLQVSGLIYKYLSRETSMYGERVDFVEVNGEVIVRDGKILFPEKKFRVVSNDYVVGHAEDKYFGFPVKQARDTQFPLDQTLVEWLVEYKVLDYSFEPRIIRITQQP